MGAPRRSHDASEVSGSPETAPKASNMAGCNPALLGTEGGVTEQRLHTVVRRWARNSGLTGGSVDAPGDCPANVLDTNARNRWAESAAACSMGAIKPAAMAGFGSLPTVAEGAACHPRRPGPRHAGRLQLKNVGGQGHKGRHRGLSRQATRVNAWKSWALLVKHVLGQSRGGGCTV